MTSPADAMTLARSCASQASSAASRPGRVLVFPGRTYGCRTLTFSVELAVGAVVAFDEGMSFARTV